MRVWQRLQHLLDAALELPAAEARAFLRAQCAGDAALLQEAEQLYDACLRSDDFLAAPPAELLRAALHEREIAAADVRRQVGPYRLIQEIGRGGMGVVYLAEREDVGKRVALKVLSGEIAAPGRVERFLHERRVLARLEHPNIARLHDVGVTADGTPWLAMEYVAGQRIDAWCATRQAGLRERLAIFERVCDAVACAHRNLIVHRDLKPSNILVTDDGEPRLVDFGIAKLLENATGDALTVADARPMTPEYASPEQLQGLTITTASDVYQLGLLLHELVTGKRAERPSGSNTHEPQRTVSSETDIENIVRMALRAEPGQRYESALQLRDDVRRYLSGRPVLARAATWRYRARKFAGRHKAGVSMAAALTVVLLSAAVMTVVQNRRVSRERDRATQVSNLLIDLFASSDPTVTAGDTVTVRAVLERGASRIRADQQLDPIVRARLLEVIAVAYRNLGMLDRAIELATEGVAALQTALPARDTALLHARRTLGEWHAQAGQADAALPVLEEVLNRELQRGRKPRADLAEALHGAAWAHQLNQQADTAQALYEAALAIYRQLPRAEANDLDVTLSNLAALAIERSELEKADTLLREALALRRERLGATHPLTARSMNSLARLLVRRNELDAAEQLAEQAQQVLTRALPSPHSDLVDGYLLESAIALRRGRLADAEASQRAALAMNRALYGDIHATVARATADLGGLVQRQGRLDEAAQLHEQAASQYRAIHGERSRNEAIVLTNLAYTEFLRRRLPESEALYRRALPVLDSLANGEAASFTTYADFATVLQARGNHAEAEKNARRSYELARTRLPENHVDVIRPQRLLGQSLVLLRRYAEAEPLLLDAQRKLSAGWGQSNIFTIGATNDIVRMYELWGRPADAERYRQAASRPAK